MPGRVPVTLAALTLIGGSLLTGSSAQAAELPAVHTAAPVTCSGADHDRVLAGHQGSDPNSLSSTAARSAERKLTALGSGARTRARAASLVTIDVRVHVITERNRTGAVSAKRIKRQISVLNKAYAGRTWAGGRPTIFQFALRSIDVTRNNNWYSWSDPDADPTDNDGAKKALRKGGFDDLNVYVTGLEDGLLGYATFPWEADLSDDGVVVLNDSLPGGAAVPYNEGDTLTHEVGHWLGLLHTFQGGCAAPGDQVSDTPYQDDGENVLFCNESDDTCPQPGRDPVHNFMSYGDDPCLDRFTPGQSARMTLAWFAFRQPGGLLP